MWHWTGSAFLSNFKLLLNPKKGVGIPRICGQSIKLLVNYLLHQKGGVWLWYFLKSRDDLSNSHTVESRKNQSDFVFPTFLIVLHYFFVGKVFKNHQPIFHYFGRIFLRIYLIFLSVKLSEMRLCKSLSRIQQKKINWIYFMFYLGFAKAYVQIWCQTFITLNMCAFVQFLIHARSVIIVNMTEIWPLKCAFGFTRRAYRAPICASASVKTP